MTKVTIAIQTKLKLAKFILYVTQTKRVDLPQIDGEFSTDLDPGTYDIAVASKGNNKGDKATFTFSTAANSISKSVKAGESGKVSGFLQFTLAGGKVAP